MGERPPSSRSPEGGPATEAGGRGDAIRCPLCRSDRAAPLARAHGRRYLECPACRLTFIHPADRPSPDAERARYDTHENDPADPRYRAFLARLADPLIKRLTPGAEGLDYGSGPGPTLSVMLEEAGFPMTVWDPFFAPDPAPLERTYDFITCTETAEHFFDPAAELDRLDRLLRPAGWLALMTEPRLDDRSFEDWHYVRDPTHVCFYHAATLEWIARDRGWILERPARTVALFRKRRDRAPGARAAPGSLRPKPREEPTS